MNPSGFWPGTLLSLALLGAAKNGTAQAGGPRPTVSPRPSAPVAAELDAGSAPAVHGAHTGSSDAIDSPPASPEQLHARAVAEIGKGRPGKAVPLLRQAIESSGESALFVTDLGFAYLLQGHLREAESAFRSAIELDLTRPHAYVHLAATVAKEPERWEKRDALFRTLAQGLVAVPRGEGRTKIEVAFAQAERAYGLLEAAAARCARLLDPSETTGLSLPLRRQVQKLQESIALDQKARTLADWPEPAILPADEARLAEARRWAGAHEPQKVLLAVDPVIQAYPAFCPARELRARALSELRHYDEAVAEWTVITRLTPSDAMAHRQLGLILAEHGGFLGMQRADEALRTALALEPEWTELEAARQRLSERRAGSSTRASGHKRNRASEEQARNLLERAEELLDEEHEDQRGARALLERAIAVCPGYVPAATLLYTLTGKIPDETVKALNGDAEELFSLVRELRYLPKPPPASLWQRWLDRAAELGCPDALFERAVDRHRRGLDKEAELDLSAVLALATDARQIDAARALRGELRDRRKDQVPEAETAILQARLRLERDDARGALEILQAPCNPGMQGERLLALGLVYERTKDYEAALRCYELGLDQRPGRVQELALSRRMARLLARGSVGLQKGMAPARVSSLAELEPSMCWALARRALGLGDLGAARRHIDEYLRRAAASDRFRGEAVATRDRLRLGDQQRVEQQRRLHQRMGFVGISALAFLAGLVYFPLYRGRTLAQALARRPRLYPEMAEVIGELRHDVLKHRTSALGLLRDDQTTIETLRTALLTPEPVSHAVAAAYARLAGAARAEGIGLRRLRREPVLGSLFRDLRRVEKLVARKQHKGQKPAILAVDERLRHVHPTRLKQLLALGPQCQVDAAELQRWIAVVEHEWARDQKRFVAPALRMSDLVLHFPLERQALFQIFANLLRNAQAAVGALVEPRVVVVLGRDKDFTGRERVTLQVGDNSTVELSLEAIESRDTGRGLAVLRDLTRHYQGQIVIRPAEAPYCKYVGVGFAQ
jgi:tetratricopeptide (TPR) repeat protein